MSIIDHLTNNGLHFLGIPIIGAVSYWIASGASRANYKAFNVALGVSVFSTLWIGIYWTIEQIFDCLPTNILISSVAVLIFAGIWRKWLATCASSHLRKWGITTVPFGPAGTWEYFESIPDGREFHYIRVHLTNGDQLGSNQGNLVRENKNKKFDFLPDMIIDERGNVVLVVTDTWKNDSNTEEKNEPVDERGHTKFTYIPASNITKIEAYIKKAK